MKTFWLDTGSVIIVEKADGNKYVLTEEHLLGDMGESRNYAPADDDRVLFAAMDGEPVDPQLCPNFEFRASSLWGRCCDTAALPDKGAVIVTENVSGRMYMIIAERQSDVLDDWNGDCDYVPENDAKVFFSARNGKCDNPYPDFESLLSAMRGAD